MFIIALVLLAVLSTIVNFLFHIKVTKTLRRELHTERTNVVRQTQRMEEWRDIARDMERGRGTNYYNGNLAVPEDTARQVLSKLYHIAKTNSKEETLRGAVLNWSRKHMRVKNQGE